MKCFTLFFATLICAILMSSCDVQSTEIVYFETAQPEHKKNLNQIPRKYRGEFYSPDSFEQLIIDKTTITKVRKFEWKESMVSLAGDSIFTNDTSFSDANSEVIVLPYNPDSACIQILLFDSIFRIGAEQQLRRYKNYLFLNYKEAEDEYIVKTMTLNKKHLYLSEFIPTNLLDTIQPYVTIDTLSHPSIDSSSYSSNYKVQVKSKKDIKEILRVKQSNSWYIKK